MLADQQYRGETLADREIVALDEEELGALVQQEINDSIGGDGSIVSKERRENLAMYMGEPFGNEQIGRSAAQLTDVADTIEWIMPSLARMFFGGDQVVRFRPNNEEDVEAAEQASDYMNEVFLQQEEGFLSGYDWFKTSLIERNSTMKAYYEELEFPEIFPLEQLTQADLEMVAADGQMEFLEVNPREDTLVVENEETGDLEDAPTFDVVLRRIAIKRRIRTVAIPPEEFLTSRDEVTLPNDETRFACHRVKKTVSDLIAMGIDPDVALQIPSDDEAEFSVERTARRSDDETYPNVSGERQDRVSRQVWINDCWMRVDFDGDGYAELRHVMTAGTSSMTVLINEYATHSPFAEICPIPMPHKRIGRCPADQVKDLQVIRSTILRQILDNMYVLNNGRWEVVEGAVDIDDMLSSLPGGIVRTTAPGMVKSLETPALPGHAFSMLEFLEGTKEQRTGITRYNQGTDAASLNKTAFGIGAIMEAANQRIELIGRILAEGGVKRLFRIMLHLMIEHPVKDQVVKLRGKWVPVDPTTWDPEWKMDIEVGLGQGQAQQRMQTLMSLAQHQQGLQKAGMGGLIVTPKQAYRLAHEMQVAAGYKVDGYFFQDPEGVEPPPPPPDPAMEKVKQSEGASRRDHELKLKELEVDALRIEQDGEIRRYEIDLRGATEREKIASAERIASERLQGEIEKAEISAAAAEQRAAKANGDARGDSA
jgi:hypothetical protein